MAGLTPREMQNAQQTEVRVGGNTRWAQLSPLRRNTKVEKVPDQSVSFREMKELLALSQKSQ